MALEKWPVRRMGVVDTFAFWEQEQLQGQKLNLFKIIYNGKFFIDKLLVMTVAVVTYDSWA
jgi:hypothetical protein